MNILDLAFRLQLSALHPIHEHHILYAVHDLSLKVQECYLTLIKALFRGG